jgi:hypothetical protein
VLTLAANAGREAPPLTRWSPVGMKTCPPTACAAVTASAIVAVSEPTVQTDSGESLLAAEPLQQLSKARSSRGGRRILFFL